MVQRRLRLVNASRVGRVEEHTALAADGLRLREGLARDAILGMLVGERLIVSRAADPLAPPNRASTARGAIFARGLARIGNWLANDTLHVDSIFTTITIKTQSVWIIMNSMIMGNFKKQIHWPLPLIIYILFTYFRNVLRNSV